MRTGTTVDLPAQVELAQWAAAVDEDSTIGGKDSPDARQRSLTRRRMATIECADPNGKYDVERLVVGLQDERLGIDLADAHPTRRNLLARASAGLRHRLG